jgi:6-phosphofructokinase 1
MRKLVDSINVSTLSLSTLLFMKKIAMLTSGGDAPGMNACIRSIVLTCVHHNILPLGIIDGYKGLIEGRIKRLTRHEVYPLIDRGGTFLGAGRCREFLDKVTRLIAIQFLHQANIDGLIVVGGDGTFLGAKALWDEMNIPIIGIPSTIDNDVEGTDYCIGFDTAVNNAMNAIDKIRDTANSHHRFFIVEVMGRHTGKLAQEIALSSGADFLLLPEDLSDTNMLMSEVSNFHQYQRGKIIIVAEGDETGGALQLLKKLHHTHSELSVRHSVLGHIQRGGSPTAYDRNMGAKMGERAVEWILAGKSGVFTAIKNNMLMPVEFKYKT